MAIRDAVPTRVHAEMLFDVVADLLGDRAWVESDRSVQLKLLTARQARIAGVALWVRGGESSATWRQPLLSPPGGAVSR